MRIAFIAFIATLILSQAALAQDTSGITPDQKYFYALERAYEKISTAAIDTFATNSFKAKHHLRLEEQRRDEALALELKERLETDPEKKQILQELKVNVQLEEKDEQEKAENFGSQISDLAQQKDFLGIKQLIFEKRAEHLNAMEERGLNITSLREKEQAREKELLAKINETDSKIKARLKE